MSAPRFRVLVDDNSHFMDDDERWTLGVYDTAEEALAACRRLVDASLAEGFEPGMSADALFGHYKAYGDDPFITSIDGQGTAPVFSAWQYAEERAKAMCEPGAVPAG